MTVEWVIIEIPKNKLKGAIKFADLFSAIYRNNKWEAMKFVDGLFYLISIFFSPIDNQESSMHFLLYYTNFGKRTTIIS